MDTSHFRVDQRMIPPVVLAMGFGAFLIFLESPGTSKGLLLLALLTPFFYLGAEILARKIVLDANGIHISKFLRSTSFRWSEISLVDAVRAGNKVFLILQPEEGKPALITNTIRPFDKLVARIIDKIPPERVADGAADTLASSPSKLGPLVQAWIVCLVFIGLVAGKLLGYS